MKRKNVHYFLHLVFLVLCFALLNCAYTGSPTPIDTTVQSDALSPVEAPYSAEEIEAESLSLDTRGSIPGSVGFTWRPGQAVNSSPYYTVKESPTGKLWVELNLRPEGYAYYKKAMIYVTYTDNPTGWMVNIGDSKTNNGYAGDGATQSHDAELQVYNRGYALYASDYGNSARIRNISNFAPATGSKWMRFYVADGYTSYYSANSSGSYTSNNLFALNGEADGEGKTNFKIYAGFNRVISGTSRVGRGVNYVVIRLVDKVATQQWTKPTVSGEVVMNMLQRHELDYLLVGHKGGKMMIKNVSDTGVTRWTKVLSRSSELTHIIYDTENYNYIAAGLYNAASSGLCDHLVLYHIDHNGNILKSQTLYLGFKASDIGEMITTSRNEIVILIKDMIYKYDANFNLIFTKQINFQSPGNPGTDPIVIKPDPSQLQAYSNFMEESALPYDELLDPIQQAGNETRRYYLYSVIESGSDLIIAGSVDILTPQTLFAGEGIFLRLDRNGTVKQKVVTDDIRFVKIFKTTSHYLTFGHWKKSREWGYCYAGRLSFNGTSLGPFENSYMTVKYVPSEFIRKFRDGALAGMHKYRVAVNALIFYDANGNETFRKEFPNVSFSSFIATGDGGIFAVTKNDMRKLDQNCN